MLFYSLDFLVLFPIVCCLYFISPYRYRWILLLIASYLFYAYSHWWHLFILLIATGVCYSSGLYLASQHSTGRRKIVLGLSLAVNFGLLFFFKYLEFFASEWNAAFHIQRSPAQVGYVAGILPLGISFYIFQTSGYIIDVYRQPSRLERHVGKLALFVAFFPQLIAGPIERARNLLPQFHFRYDFSILRVKAGCVRFLWGVFKKLVVADNIALYVNTVYGSPDAYEGMTIWVATILFMFQLYYDFSAYADMAIGLGTILGIRFSENFTHKLPFLQPSFAKFWQHWHITLTLWIRDYMYIPLVKTFSNRWMRWVVPLITFSAIGLWHGAGWTFVFWGFLCGVFFAVEGIRKRLIFSTHAVTSERLATWFGIALVFFLTMFTMVFFRASSMQDAMQLLQAGASLSMQGVFVIPPDQMIVALCMLGLGEMIRVQLGTQPIDQWLSDRSGWWRLLWYIVMLECIFFFGVSGGQEFIYFQF